MAKFRQKKIKPQKEHVTYLPTYIPTKVVGLPSTPKLTTFRSGMGPPCSSSIAQCQKKKRL